MAFNIDFKILRFSIVNNTQSSEVKKDSDEPYSFVDFVKNLDVDNINNDFIVDAYNKYIIEWSKVKNVEVESFAEQRKAKYVELLKEIQLNYVTQDEARILGNIDFNNPLELEVAIPFYVEKIKDIIEYYTTKRRDVSNSKAKWSTKGSKIYLENVIAEYIVDNYTKNDNTFQTYKQTFQELSSFQQDYKLEYDGLYDFNNYRTEEVRVDPSLFGKDSGDYDLSSLPITSFYDYYNSSDTLIDELKKELFKKYISIDSIYFDGLSSTAVDSETPFFDPYNKDVPYISKVSDTTNLLTDKDIGYYFTSKYIYTSNYYSPQGISFKEFEKAGLYGKPNVFLSDDYKDFYFWGKYSPDTQGLSNKPVKNKLLKRLHGYQSRDLNVGDAIGGVERYTDNVQIWTGDRNEDWANEDIFEKYTDNTLNRKSKNDSFFNLGEGEAVFKYSADIYGNEFYLIKAQNVDQTNQGDVYNLPTFSGGQIVDFILLGQSLTATADLYSIKIADNIGLGFFIGGVDDFVIENITDFHIDAKFDDYPLYTLSSTQFDTLSAEENITTNKKSLYENYYTAGRVVIRLSDSGNIGSFTTFAADIFSDFDGLYEELIDGILNIDVINDIIIITTESYVGSARILYDYDTGVITFSEVTKNVRDYHNDPMHKTASYWHDTHTEQVYSASISADQFSITPSLRMMDVKTHNIHTLIAVGDSSDFELEHPITIENISRPNVVKKENELYVLTMLKDITDNYFFHVFHYNFVSPAVIKLVSSKTFTSTLLKLNDNLDTSLSSIPTISSDLLTSLVYYNTDTDDTDTADLPYFTTEDKVYYDIDAGAENVKTLPKLAYTL